MIAVTIIGIILIWAFAFYIMKTSNNNQKENQRKQNELNEEIQKSWNMLNNEHTQKVEEYEKENYHKNKFGDLYLFKDNKLFCLNNLYSLDFYMNRGRNYLPQQLEEIIDFKDVKYYNIDGSEREKQIISGGGGGGSSIKGAVVGGLVAGEVGAIIGSRKKNEEIKTSYEKIDDRKLVITFKNGTTKDIKDFSLYEYLLENVPEKDYENYIYNLKSKGKE